jgi:hypothetical protein
VAAICASWVRSSPQRGARLAVLIRKRRKSPITVNAPVSGDVVRGLSASKKVAVLTAPENGPANRRVPVLRCMEVDPPPLVCDFPLVGLNDASRGSVIFIFVDRRDLVISWNQWGLTDK